MLILEYDILCTLLYLAFFPQPKKMLNKNICHVSKIIQILVIKVKGKSVFCQRLSRSFEKEKQNARQSALGVCCKIKLF